MNAKKYIKKFLEQSGIVINGDSSKDIKIYDERTYNRILKDGSLGVGESYMDGWWDANELDVCITEGIKNNTAENIITFGMLWDILFAKIANLQSIKRSFTVAKKHYDDRDGVYESMLGDTMTYTCGYYGRGATTLEEAQFDKHELICEKLGIKKGDKVLDIGCGFGEFARHSAKEHGANVIGVTVSKGQLEVAKKRTNGLSVEYILQDYRKIDVGEFDYVVSIGMFEHVGIKNYKDFMKIAHKHLKPNGKMLLHTIGSQISRRYGDKWLTKYIFPGGMLPSIMQIGDASEKYFVMEDWHNFGSDYDKTLMEWWKRFNSDWNDGKLQNYDKRFYRMWKFYLLMCAGLFRARKVHLWQIVFSKNGEVGGYKSVR